MSGTASERSGVVADFGREVGAHSIHKHNRIVVIISSVTVVMLLTVVAAAITKKQVAATTAAQLHTPPPSTGIQFVRGLSRDPNECISAFCNWNKNYVFSKISHRIGPCDDFYVHVCTNLWYRVGGASSRPFAEFSSAQLMMDMERFFERFHSLKGNSRASTDNFLSQAIWVYGKCKAEPLEESNVSAAIDQIVSLLDLAGWPFDDYGTGHLERLVASADRLLRLHSLFEVTLSKSAIKSTDTPIIVLKPPETIYRRFMLSVVEATDESYGNIVTKTLHLRTSRSTSFIEKRVLALEKALEESLLASEERFTVAPRSALVTLNFSSYTTWNWTAYFSDLTDNSHSAFSNTSMFFLGNPTYFRKMGHLLGSTWDTAIVNYIGYKAVIELSPFLGAIAEYLIPLTHDYSLSDIKERQEVCMVMVERLYKYGVGIAAKLTLGKEFAATYRTHFDSQLRTLFEITRGILVRLVGSRRSWISSLDTGTASLKLKSIDFSFGTESNLLEYETYRKSSNVKIDENGDFLSTILLILTHASSTFWEAWSTDSAAYDNRFTITSFRSGHEFQNVHNRLYIPHGTVAFLNHISNLIHPILYSAVPIHVVQGALKALTRSSSFVDDQGSLRQWWSSATGEAYEAIGSCLGAQYNSPGDEDRDQSVVELNFIDNAALLPLYVLYRSELKKLNQSSLFVTVDETNITAEQLFFYNFAVAHCENSDRSTLNQQKSFGVTPPRQRVNVPLRNFPVFAKAFRCRANSKMNPIDRCTVWKSPNADSA